jgi:WD40 repeat protein
MNGAVVTDKPYLGLMPYSEKDAQFFFGREREREVITANLKAWRLTLLYGASGVGKSSVLRAGIAHSLGNLARQNLAKRGKPELAVVAFNSWRDDPVAGLTIRIQDTINRLFGEQAPEQQRTAGTLESVIKEASERTGGRLLIILDQFEEYFLYHAQEQGDGTFAVEFPRAVNNPDLRVNFLISIREDALAKLDRFKGRIPNLFDNYLRIHHLNRKAARAAIVKPLEQYNLLHTGSGQQVQIEPALVEAVLDQVKKGEVVVGEAGRGVVRGQGEEEQIETPYLQLVMTRLWDEEMRAGSRVLRLETLDRLGGAENIVRTHLDKVMEDLPVEERNIAAGIFHYLVTPSGTKIAYIASDLAALTKLDEARLSSLLEKLSQSDVRILRPVDPPPDHPTAPRYEIFHDVLASSVLGWRTRYVQEQERADAERRAQEQQRKAEEQAATARRFRRLAGALAVMVLLAIATMVFAFVKQAEARENAKKAENFANESIKLRTEGEQLRAEGEQLRGEGERLRKEGDELRAEGNKAKADAMASRMTARQEQERAEEQARIADIKTLEAKTATEETALQASETRVAFSNLLAAQSKFELNENPQRSLLLAVESMKATQAGDPRVPAAEETLRQVLSQTGGRVLGGHKERVHTVAVSPNNRWLISVSGSDAKLWDLTAKDAAPRDLKNATGPVAISADNRWLVTAGKKQNAESSTEPTTQEHEAFDTDGSQNAISSTHQESGWVAYLWDLTDGPAEPVVLRGHEKYISSVAISPDSRWLVTSSGNDTAILWDLTAKDKTVHPLRLSEQENPNTVVVFSPDSRWLVTSSWNRSANRGETSVAVLWDLTAANPAARHMALEGHTSSVSNIVFSSDGRWLATSSAEYDSHTFRMDKNIRVWDLKADNPTASPKILTGHKWSIYFMTISADSRWLVTSSVPRGSIFDLTDNDIGDVRLWDLRVTDPNRTQRALSGLIGPVSRMVIGPDNRWLVTFAINRGRIISAQLWDLTTKAPDDKPLNLPSDGLNLNSTVLGVSSDKRWLIISTSDNVALVWDLTEDKPEARPRVLRGHEGTIYSVAFSPDNHQVVTGSNDGTARLWSLDTIDPVANPIVLQSTGDQTFVISRDKHRLVTLGPDGIISVSDLTAADPAAASIKLSVQEETFHSIELSPDSRWLISGGAKDAYLWDLSVKDPAASRRVFRGHSSVVSGVALSSDNRLLITGSFDGTARLWDLSAKDPVTAPIILHHDDKKPEATNAIYQVYLSPDNRWLVTKGDEAILWDLTSKDPNANSIMLGKIDSIAISPDSRWLAIASTDGPTHLWNLTAKNISAKTITIESKTNHIAISPDSRWLAVCDKDVRLLDLTSINAGVKPFLLRGHSETIDVAVFSPDKNWLVTGSYDDTARIWDLNKPDSDPVVLRGQNSPVDYIDISADSRWVVTGGFFGSSMARLWDLKAAHPEATSIALPFRGSVSRVAFSHNGSDSRWLVIGGKLDDISSNKRVSLFNMRLGELKDLACRTAGRNLLDDDSEWQRYFPGKPFHKTCPNQ